MIEVTWVGGPKDGETFAIPNYRPTWRVAMPEHFAYWDESDPLDVTFNTKDCPIRRTRDGYRVYWHKEMADEA